MGSQVNHKEIVHDTICWFKELRHKLYIMLYNAPAKGDDGLYFVKALNESKRKCLVQLNKVKIADVSGDVVLDLGSEANLAKIQAIDEQNLAAAQENCETWFGKQLSENVVKGAYTSSVVDGQLTGERIEVTKVFNAHRNKLISKMSKPVRPVMSFLNLPDFGSPRNLLALHGMSSRSEFTQTQSLTHTQKSTPLLMRMTNKKIVDYI